MVYSYDRGIKQDKSLKVPLVIAAAATAITMILGIFTSAFALDTTVSDQANSSACFGQARASYAKGGPNGELLPAGTTNGTYISERKGNNPAENAAYRDAYCTN